MQITGTHFNYYMICYRKLWLFANGKNMEHNIGLLHEGAKQHAQKRQASKP
jgi:CRISPR-associated exonuclease Cas4